MITVYLPARIDEQENLEHPQHKRDYVTIVAPQAQVELHEVFGEEAEPVTSAVMSKIMMI